MGRLAYEKAEREARVQAVARMVRNNVSQAVIASTLGITSSAASGLIHRARKKDPTLPQGDASKRLHHGEARKPSTGTREESAARKAGIIAELTRLVPVSEVAERHGVTPGYVHQVAKAAGVPLGHGVLKRARRETGDMTAIFGRAPTPVFDAPKREHGRAPWIAPAGAVPEQDKYGARTCQWIDGDPKKEEHSYCGARRYPGKPYCGKHCADAYVGRPGEAA